MVFHRMYIFIIAILICCVSCKDETFEKNMEVLLSVQSYDNANFCYSSYDKGITWENGNVPPFYMTVEYVEYRLEREDVLLTLMIVNDGECELATGMRCTLQRYEGGEWINVSLGNIVTPDIGYSVEADKRVEFTQLVPKKLEKGKYRILKDVIDTECSEKWTCSAQFEV